MTRNMNPEPTAAGEQYECRDCLTRVCTEENLATCPECGGDVENLSKPRE